MTRTHDAASPARLSRSAGAPRGPGPGPAAAARPGPGVSHCDSVTVAIEMLNLNFCLNPSKKMVFSGGIPWLLLYHVPSPNLSDPGSSESVVEFGISGFTRDS